MCVSCREKYPIFVSGSSLLILKGRHHHWAMCHAQLEQRGACQGTVTSMKESVGVIKQVSAIWSVLDVAVQHLGAALCNCLHANIC